MTTLNPNIAIQTTLVLEEAERATLIPLGAFAARLMTERGAKFIGFIAHTIPNMRQGGNPFYGKVVKISHVTGMVNFHYDDGVLRRLAKEGKDENLFRRGESYHVPLLADDDKLTPLCIHKADAAELVGWVRSERSPGKWTTNPCRIGDLRRANFVPRLYLRLMLLRSQVEYRRLSDQTIVPAEAIREYEYRSEYENQGLENPLIFLTYGLNSLRQFRLDKETFLIRHP